MQIIKNCVPRIIGISGHINSGKDLVGEIIQKFTAGKDYVADVGWIQKTPYKSPWQIKKWADKLKDIVCILIGCSREQLENREFKEKELGEEWTLWTCNFELIKGFGNFISKEEAQNYASIQANKGDLIQIYHKRLTIRELLQFIGTDLFRNQLHPNCWINATFANYKPIGDTLLEGEVRKVREEYLIYPNWIITDCRFKNEAKAIKDRGGIVIRINRDTLNTSQFRHQSEVDLDDYEFDYTIYNNSDISSLINSVRDMLIYFKIL